MKQGIIAYAFLAKYSIIVRGGYTGTGAERMLMIVALKNKVILHISGKDYTIVGSESEEYIRKVGLYIDRKMNEIIKVNSKLSTSMASVLTAINIADDYFKCYESEGSLKKELKKLCDDIQELKEEKKKLSEGNFLLSGMNSNLQLELAKTEAELREIRKSMDKVPSPRV
jgi:cell division protein ZapA